MNGIKLKPIRLRKSLYLLIPMGISKLIGVTDRTKFVLTLERDEEWILTYHKSETSPNPEEESGWALRRS